MPLPTSKDQVRYQTKATTHNCSNNKTETIIKKKTLKG